MKFIIPQNYSFKNKIFGFIPYSTLIFNIVWYFVIFSILNFFLDDWNIKIFILISLAFPITLFSILGLNGEPFIDVLKYVLKYIFSTKIYLFKKY